MSTMKGIPSVTIAPARVAADSRAPVEPKPGPAQESGQAEADAESGATTPASTDRQEIEAAVLELREAMSHMPGGEREVSLLYEPQDRSYLIEIRDKETGDLLQTFPPENLLNLRRRSADLLGVLIDRHS